MVGIRRWQLLDLGWHQAVAVDGSWLASGGSWILVCVRQCRLLDLGWRQAVAVAGSWLASGRCWILVGIRRLLDVGWHQVVTVAGSWLASGSGSCWILVGIRRFLDLGLHQAMTVAGSWLVQAVAGSWLASGGCWILVGVRRWLDLGWRQAVAGCSGSCWILFGIRQWQLLDLVWHQAVAVAGSCLASGSGSCWILFGIRQWQLLDLVWHQAVAVAGSWLASGCCWILVGIRRLLDLGWHQAVAGSWLASGDDGCWILFGVRQWQLLDLVWHQAVAVAGSWLASAGSWILVCIRQWLDLGWHQAPAGSWLASDGGWILVGVRRWLLLLLHIMDARGRCQSEYRQWIQEFFGRLAPRPQTLRLLEKRGEAKDVQRALGMERVKFQATKKGHSLRWEKLNAQEAELRNYIFRFQHVIAETEVRRLQAGKKAKREEEICNQKTGEVRLLQEKERSLLKRKEKIQTQVQQHRKFSEYMESIVEASEEFQVASDVLNRFHTLVATSHYLQQLVQEAQASTEQIKGQLSTIMEDKSDQVLQLTHQLGQLRAALEEAQNRRLLWETRWTHIQNLATKKTLLIGTIKMAALNLYQSIAPPDRRTAIDDTMRQMDMVQQYLQDLSDINEATQRQLRVQKSQSSRNLPKQQ
ncbi:uncharacterized protein LOC130323722 [Hyla sarda]|uniref:uncharacterized protein LOC130323722 n=1 Tax=Hyla sarda TaxID=327740 RepID=UPI0024C3004E|nr:uncharacterized protein LOC130323722 [Hyla sarda]